MDKSGRFQGIERGRSKNLTDILYATFIKKQSKGLIMNGRRKYTVLLSKVDGMLSLLCVAREWLGRVRSKVDVLEPNCKVI